MEFGRHRIDWDGVRVSHNRLTRRGVRKHALMIDRHIGGCTVHSWASIGTGEESVTNLVDMISMQPDALERWQVSQALIIDESTYNFNG
jgi:hypothetical protein